MGMMSPSMASSYAGSVIDGLDAVSLPPVEDVFSPEEYDMGGRGRRSSSVYSGYSMGNNRSPVIRPVGSFSPRQGLIGSGSTGITPEIRRASISDDRTGGSPAKSSFNNTAAAVAVTAAPHVFRSESPASSGLLRAESPAAMSAVSNVSVRVQDTIHALERAANATPMRKPDTVLEMLHQTGSSTSGVKRVGNNDVFDEFASPSKRPRAPSMATQSTPAQPEEEKTLLRNPFSAMRNMVRRHTRR
ncbi:hypothetical protein IWW45_001297 [Coemansia sp. RSA 485]|nr:hypothetical protein IWW45_001297 [Coemansia sp. RSA 485]